MYDTAEKFKKLQNKKTVAVLGIESSCDETAAAVVVNGRKALSNVIASQISVHRRFGGVVPEVASRNHTMAAASVIDEALIRAGVALKDIDAVAVTYGAGLAGALLVGVTAAKSLAYAAGLPLIKVNHIEAHIAANYVAFPELEPPFLALVAKRRPHIYYRRGGVQFVQTDGSDKGRRYRGGFRQDGASFGTALSRRARGG